MLSFLQFVVGAAVIVVGYMFLRAYTGIHLGEWLLQAIFGLFGFSTKWLQSASRDYATKSKLRFSRENKAQREKDKIYQYYRFVDDILASMGLRQFGITSWLPLDPHPSVQRDLFHPPDSGNAHSRCPSHHDR